MAEVDWVNLPFQEAVAYLKSLRPMTRAAFDRLSQEARARAFTVARITKVETLQQILDKLEETLQSGGSLIDFAELVDGVSALTDFHVQTVFNTNIQSAYGLGRYEQMTDPDIADLIWGWRYHTVGDDRVRDEHDALDGMVFATGDGEEFFPPWDFNCRCSSEIITQAEAEEEGLSSSSVPQDVRDAVRESDFTSPALRSEYTPDTGGYDLGLISEFVKDQEGAEQ